MVSIIKKQPNIQLHRIFRIAVIAAGIMAGPGILFILPYLLPISKFASFAAVLAIAQLIAGLGGFGLDVSCPRLGIKVQWAAVYSLFFTLLASIIVFFCFGITLSEKFILSSLIAWVVSLTTIFHSYSIFAGKVKLYGIIGLAKAIVFLVVLTCAIYIGVSPAVAWFFAALSGLFVALFMLMINGGGVVNDSTSESDWMDVVKFSTPLAIIVAAGALPFVFDRAVAQYVLSESDFARYAVAVTWAVPIIYIGNVIQQTMIAEKTPITIKTLFFWCGVIFVMSLIYISFIGVIGVFFIKVPYFSDGIDFIRIWGWIAGWYAIFSAVSFPISAVMQKHFSAIQLKSLAYATIGIIVFFLLFAYGLYVSLFTIEFIINKTLTIILLTGFFSVVGAAAKIVFVFRYLAK